MGCEHILVCSSSIFPSNEQEKYWGVLLVLDIYPQPETRVFKTRGVIIYRVILISNLELGEDTRDQNSIHILLDTMGIIVKGVQSMFIMEMINNEFELYATEVARW